MNDIRQKWTNFQAGHAWRQTDSVTSVKQCANFAERLYCPGVRVNATRMHAKVTGGGDLPVWPTRTCFCLALPGYGALVEVAWEGKFSKRTGAKERQAARQEFLLGTVVKIDCRQSTYSFATYSVKYSFHLLYPSPDFISFCVIPALFSSPAIPSICKILKLCPFGILSVLNSTVVRCYWNVASDCTSPTEDGREFQARAAVAGNTQSPRVRHRVAGMISVGMSQATAGTAARCQLQGLGEVPWHYTMNESESQNTELKLYPLRNSKTIEFTQ